MKIQVLNPYSESVLKIIQIIETISPKKASYKLIDKKSKLHLNSDISMDVYKLLGVEFSLKYTESLIKKYFFK